jgi:hypothetical protein
LESPLNGKHTIELDELGINEKMYRVQKTHGFKVIDARKSKI